jgi:hypothetical protein
MTSLFNGLSEVLFAYGYDVNGMILLRHLKAAMRRDGSKDMCMNIWVYITYEFNALAPTVWMSWR